MVSEVMLAILAGKLDPAGGTPHDRSEDVLTDAVFGAIRHLPYSRCSGRCPLPSTCRSTRRRWGGVH
ncbi:hypothetical protein AB1484_19780 [Parafrankia sp. FMc6]|uniref:hypothetical protein n=1 Tax=Parafrankia soli TaxID=2599596 RepID=UPI0034D40697